jgi:hypothetical protein
VRKDHKFGTDCTAERLQMRRRAMRAPLPSAPIRLPNAQTQPMECELDPRTSRWNLDGGTDRRSKTGA